MALQPVAHRRARILCPSCGRYFPVSARRVRMIQDGRATRFCRDCRELARRKPVVVLAEHRRFWTDMIREGERSRSGELITEAWVFEVADQIWGRR